MDIALSVHNLVQVGLHTTTAVTLVETVESRAYTESAHTALNSERSSEIETERESAESNKS